GQSVLRDQERMLLRDPRNIGRPIGREYVSSALVPFRLTLRDARTERTRTRSGEPRAAADHLGGVKDVVAINHVAEILVVVGAGQAEEVLAHPLVAQIQSDRAQVVLDPGRVEVIDRGPEATYVVFRGERNECSR